MNFATMLLSTPPIKSEPVKPKYEDGTVKARIIEYLRGRPMTTRALSNLMGYKPRATHIYGRIEELLEDEVICKVGETRARYQERPSVIYGLTEEQ